MLVFDGSYGEGGGQIVRSALALAALTGRTVRLENIRAKRPKPGLRPQHLTAVRALAEITGATLSGAQLGATSLTFAPQGIFPGSYRFDVAQQTGSAGAVTLLAQTLLPVLSFAPGPSSLVLLGGTHVPWSPPFHYLAWVFLPALQQLGLTATAEIRRWGFYPRGGGEIHLQLTPVTRLQGVDWTTPPTPTAFQGLSAAANLPDQVIRRQSQTLRAQLPWPLPIREEKAPSPGPGSFVFLWGPQAGFAALGAKGKPAEQVATEAVAAFQGFLQAAAGVDRHLADQILLYAALAGGPTVFSTDAITLHLLTNSWVIRQFLEVSIAVQGNMQQPGIIRVQGLGYRTGSG
ncbi:MAG: RNA 3'-terminal phosphate cyclase [Desulfobacca sp.]|uniref:RNA 3'-terminal phosphate cyclase n=1 Tax=Desulfobacca sp. TaxID=2067990 RepID=UPI00404A2441